MNASELRIGNYVRYSSLIQVDGYKIAECEDYPNRFTPILLTEEWLLKFGFEKDVDNSFVLGNLSIFTDKRFKENVFIQTKTNRSFSGGQWVILNDLKIQHIHQLQNLYFALTGEELQLT